MPYCTECGEELEEGVEVCPECGTPVSPSASEEGSETGIRIGIKTIAIIIIAAAIAGVGGWVLMSMGGGGGHPATNFAKMIPENSEYFSVESGEYIEGMDGNVPDYLDNVSNIEFTAGGPDVTIWSGSFSMDDVRDYLNNRDFNKSEYKNVETWERNGQWIAIKDGKIINGNESNVKNCIETMRGELDSLYDNEDARTLLDKLRYEDLVQINLSIHWYEENVRATAWSREILDENVEKFNLQALYLLENSDATKDFADQMRKNVETSEDEGNIDYESLRINTDGHIVELILKGFEQSY